MRFQNNEHSPHHGLFEVEFVVEVEVEVEVGVLMNLLYCIMRRLCHLLYSNSSTLYDC